MIWSEVAAGAKVEANAKDEVGEARAWRREVEAGRLARRGRSTQRWR